MNLQILDLDDLGGQHDKAKDAHNADPFLDTISQKVTSEDEIDRPLGCSKLAGIANNVFAEKLEEEKLKQLLKIYYKLENCPGIITPKCNPKTWKNNVI